MKDIIVRAGRHPRAHCPVRVTWDGTAVPAALAGPRGVAAVQQDGGAIAFLVGPLAAGEEARYRPAGSAPPGGVKLIDESGAIRVEMDGNEFTTYVHTDVPARPYFWPVLAPGGIPVTRAFPMRTGLPGETQDHPHHRSLYFAYGNVNGADNWSEEKGHGFTVHRSIDELVSGPVFGRFSTTGDWQDSAHRKLLTQRVTVTVWRGDGERRFMDVDLRLIATEGDVLFADTKEGGMLSVRVVSSMDVPRGGRIENSYGGIDEGETWGRAAHWCDYSGAAEGERVGIAVMDHPKSFRYPTYWHVRDYGLMTANPFALNDYTRGEKRGDHLLKAGDTLRFVYRVLVHKGDAAEADVRSHYIGFVSPPDSALE